MTPTRRPHVRRLQVAGAAAACALLLAGCGSGADDPRSGGADASTTLTDAAAANGAVAATDGDAPVEVVGGNKEAGGPGFNHSDIAFVQMMVPHHRQSVELADLARTRSEDPAVRRLAASIRAEQLPQVEVMTSWLEAHDIDVPTTHDDPESFDHSKHGHDPMMGMLSHDDLHALEDASGAEFDRLFLSGMLAHHEGAVGMAQTVAQTGVDDDVSALAATVISEQTAEMDEIRALQ